jgi:coenzyme PQQ synthesis protein D (PqqD)
MVRCLDACANSCSTCKLIRRPINSYIGPSKACFFLVDCDGYHFITTRKTKVSKLLPSIKPNPNVIFRRLGNEIVLFHLETDRFYELNDTAARFWELLSDNEGGAQIQEKMLAEFEIESDDLAKEAEALVASLKKEDLVSVSE